MVKSGSPAPKECAGPPAGATANGTAGRVAKNVWYLRCSAVITCEGVTASI
jgi:hypothetical protein